MNVTKMIRSKVLLAVPMAIELIADVFMQASRIPQGIVTWSSGAIQEILRKGENIEILLCHSMYFVYIKKTLRYRFYTLLAPVLPSVKEHPYIKINASRKYSQSSNTGRTNNKTLFILKLTAYTKLMCWGLVFVFYRFQFLLLHSFCF